jgi:putative DNA primase/helicase
MNNNPIGVARQPAILDRNDPISTARELVRQRFMLDDLRAIHFYRSELFAYARGRYRVIDSAEIRAAIWTFLEEAQRMEDGRLDEFKPTQNIVSNVLDALKAVCHLNSQQDMPMWLEGGSGRHPAGEILVVANGLLHVPTRELLPATPALFTTSASDAAFNAAATAPQWDHFLDEVFADDIKARDLLQEWFGYNLIPITYLQKVMLIIGPKRGGKGIMLRILTALLGSSSVAAMTLADLAKDFGKKKLIGKPACVMSDVRFSKRSDPASVAENLLSISGEDTVCIQRKFLDDWIGRLPTRFTMATNELPKLEDSSGALVERFLVLQLTQSWAGREDTSLFDRLSGELSGILNWALNGYARLMDSRRFDMPDSSADVIMSMKAGASPVSTFVEERCVQGPSLSVPRDVLYMQWVNWSGVNGQPCGTSSDFGKALKAAFPEIKDQRPRREGGARIWVYGGIGLAGGTEGKENIAPMNPPKGEAEAKVG